LILRDRNGREQLEAHIADDFEFNGATLSIVCPDSEATRDHGEPVLCVRLQKGVVEMHGQRFENEPDQPKWLFAFTAELVADCLRAARPNHPPEFEALESPPLQPERNEPKATRARKTSKRDVEDQPTLW